MSVFLEYAKHPFGLPSLRFLAFRQAGNLFQTMSLANTE